MIRDYLLFAYRNTTKRSLRTWLTTIGIFVGIAAVVSLISLGQGMQAAINQQFAGVGTDKIIIQGASAGFGPPGQNTAGKVEEHDLNLIKNVLGVKRAAGRLLRSVSVEHGDTTRVLFGASLPEEADARQLVIEANSLKVVRGEFLRPNDKRKIMVGNQFITENYFTKTIHLGTNILVNNIKFQIVGILDKIGAGRDEVVIMNENDLRDLLNEKKQFSALVAQVAQGETPSVVADQIASTLRRDRHQKEGFEDFTLTTSESLLSSINTILGVVQAVFIGIAAISLLVGSIGITNTMYTSVVERTREIGIMKAVGAKSHDILLIFTIESGLLGAAGGVMGVILGILLSKLVESIGQGVLGNLLKANFPGYLIVSALIFSFLLGAISGALPAYQASRLPPIKALRGE